MAEILDLLGDPIPDNWGKRGRPAHIPTQQNRNRVSMAVALGWSNARIAAALYITIPTLRQHYFSELHYRKVARDRLNMGVATKLWEGVQDGNVAAIREFRDFVERNDLMTFGQASTPLKPERTRKLGKKEAAIAAAHAPDASSPLGELMARRQDLN